MLSPSFSLVKRAALGAIFVTSFLSATQAFAANRFWVGSGSTTGTNFGDIANWSDTSGGTRGSSVPSTDDVAIFDKNGGIVQLNAAVRVKGFRMSTSFTGSIIQGTGSLVVGTDGIQVGSGRFLGNTGVVTTSGSFTQSGGQLTFQGRLAFSGAVKIIGSNTRFVHTGSLAVFNGVTNQLFTSTSTTRPRFNSITIANAGLSTANTVTASGSNLFSMSGALMISVGKLNLTTQSVSLAVRRGITIANNNQASLISNSNITASGSFVNYHTGTGLIMTGGTLTLNSKGNQTLAVGSGTLYNLTLRNLGRTSANTVTVSGSVLSLSGSLRIATGTLDLNTASKRLASDGSIFIESNASGALLAGPAIALTGVWSKGANGTFTRNTSTVTMNGTGQTLSGSTVFYAFTKTVSGLDTLLFQAGSLQTISGGTLNMSGISATQPLYLQSTTQGTRWSINPTGTRSVAGLDVRDSENTNATLISCVSACVDRANNIGWNFASTVGGSATGVGGSGGSGGGGGGGGGRVSRPTSPAPTTQKPTAVVPKGMTWDGWLKMKASDRAAVLKNLTPQGRTQFLKEIRKTQKKAPVKR